MPSDVFYTVKSVTWDAWNNEYIYKCTVTGPHGYSSKSTVSESELLIF